MKDSLSQTALRVRFPFLTYIMSLNLLGPGATEEALALFVFMLRGAKAPKLGFSFIGIMLCICQ